ncbi:hypothetical protein [Daejeonella sp. H1SJ63]|jgi:preprotein translocase subunit YajC|uniref:hypothetical protein n=1 Tax=Daejeonella sp. H1SJ63 TaxID=3034145 RepID=UPI0023ED72B7|nr:hypothetical protein [Daejeonella sp. H1SJ63]
MEINFLTVGIVLVIAIALIVFIIRRNNKDEKTFEEDMNKESTVPEAKKGKDESI